MKKKNSECRAELFMLFSHSRVAEKEQKEKKDLIYYAVPRIRGDSHGDKIKHEQPELESDPRDKSPSL